MKPISHRGNLIGPDPKIENNPIHIQMLIDSGMECEVDLWAADGKLWFGHDQGDYWVTPGYIKQRGLWVHCKNLAALEVCAEIGSINFFWHQNDDYTLTSKGFIWTYPDKQPPQSQNGVIVDLSRDWRSRGYNCRVCADYVE